jgi:hypothetical protein
MSFLLLFKSLILKFTLIAIILKVFKKYSIFRKLWTIFNTILVAIFGISIVDIFQIDILSNLLHNILDVFSNFRSNLLELFGKKIETPTKMGTMNRNDSSSTGIQSSNKESNKIIERFNKIINNEPEVIEDNTPIYKNKYFIMGSFLLISGLTYYYFGDEVKTYSLSLWELIRRRRPGDDNPNGTNGNNMNPVSSFFGLNRNNGLFSLFVSGDDSTEVIEVINETTNTEKIEKAVSFVDQNKPFTSPSLDNLN